MELVLVRYAEMGLKSRAVRKRFENILVENMMSALAGAGIEGIVRSEQGRLFVQTDRVDPAVRVLSRVFGVSSVSAVVQVSSELQEMRRAIASYSLDKMRQGRSFAVRARRTGDHPYTSMELGKELGSAIWLANEDKRPRVDLKRPDLEFFVEVRDNRAYIFSRYIGGPGGLPMGSQGRVVALLERDRDALAAWLIMKRGCRVIGIGEEGTQPVEILRRWDPDMRLVPPGELADIVKRNRAVAAVFGYGIEDFQKIKELSIPAPAFFPVIGMTKEEIEERISAIRA
jgi:thiamine biosynthesis protein ThiI